MKTRLFILSLVAVLTVGTAAAQNADQKKTATFNAEFKPTNANRGLYYNARLDIGVRISGSIHEEMLRINVKTTYSNIRYMYEGKSYPESALQLNNTVSRGPWGSCEIGVQYESGPVVWVLHRYPEGPYGETKVSLTQLGITAPKPMTNAIYNDALAKTRIVGVRNATTGGGSSMAEQRLTQGSGSSSQTTQQQQQQQQQQTAQSGTGSSAGTSSSSQQQTAGQSGAGHSTGTQTGIQGRPQQQQQQSSADREFEETKQRAIKQSNTRVEQSQRNAAASWNNFENALAGIAAQRAVANEAAAQQRQEQRDREIAAHRDAVEMEREQLRARSEENKYADVMAALRKYEMVFIEGGTVPTKKGTGMTVSHDFYIGKVEVPVEFSKAVLGAGGTSSTGSRYAGQNTDRIPFHVWTDELESLLRFIEELNRITGMNFRLPTEAEWEFAARGGTQSRGYKFSGGNNAKDVAWYNKNSVYLYKWSNPTRPQYVGLKQPNELGLHDMSGNVAELCQGGRYRGGSNKSESTSALLVTSSNDPKTVDVGLRLVHDMIPDVPAATTAAPAASSATATTAAAGVESPQFLGSTNLSTFAYWVANRISYPKAAVEAGITGKVNVKFIVEADGTISSVEVEGEANPLLAAEAVRVVKSSPPWTPALKDGKPVRISFTVPVNFSL